jgi:hypothetical protein
VFAQQQSGDDETGDHEEDVNADETAGERGDPGVIQNDEDNSYGP